MSGGGFVGFALDLGVFDFPFNFSTVCVYSDLPLVGVSGSELRVLDWNFSCFGFYLVEGGENVFVRGGFVLAEPGEYVLLRVYVFDGRFVTPYGGLDEFYDVLDSASVVFERRVRVV